MKITLRSISCLTQFNLLNCRHDARHDRTHEKLIAPKVDKLNLIQYGKSLRVLMLLTTQITTIVNTNIKKMNGTRLPDD